MAGTKLNSMRFLESQKVAYEVKTYDDSIHDAQEAARAIGVPVEQVYKTLVVERPAGGKPMLVMIAANRQLDLKKFAAAIGEKKVNMSAHADAEALTGLKVGGIGALALTHKNWTVYLDRPATALPHICVSAGQRGTNLRVPVADLIRILKAKVVDATEPPEL
ncbi:MAG: aminoacyl-tRNA deacylase [Anaerolineae bacterium]|nr:aminoacyl-tRNA deacylase [Anaerolineae bacterium]